MKKTYLVSGTVFFALCSYLIGGIIVGNFLGDIKLTDVWGYALYSVAGAAILSFILFLIVEKLVWKNDERFSTNLNFSNKFSIAIVSIAFVAGSYVNYSRVTNMQSAIAAEQARWNAMTPEQQQAEVDERVAKQKAKELETQLAERQKKNADWRFKVAYVFMSELKKSMRDPSSFEVEEAWANERGSIVCVQYRAKNGFGGYNREIAVLNGDKISKSANTWNKNCTKNMYDVTGAKYAL
ncbi:MAG: hypothetical protein FGM53_03885 [Rhodocyclaceae bacterium]|nr:hypothetical protein [Rhodocyclaceae bacterium]